MGPLIVDHCNFDDDIVSTIWTSQSEDIWDCHIGTLRNCVVCMLVKRLFATLYWPETGVLVDAFVLTDGDCTESIT